MASPVTYATNRRSRFSRSPDRQKMSGINRESKGLNSRYGASPLAEHDRALKTAAALLLLEVSRASINFELRRQHGFTEGHAAEVIREASALNPRPVAVRSVRRRVR